MKRRFSAVPKFLCSHLFYLYDSTRGAIYLWKNQTIVSFALASSSATIAFLWSSSCNELKYLS